MKSRTIILSPLAVLVLSSVSFAQMDPPPPEPPVPVTQAPPKMDPVPVTDNQKLYAPPSSLIAPEQAQAIVERFKAAYAKLGNPRVLFYVNRDLVDIESGLQLTGRKQRTTSTQSQVKSDMTPTGTPSSSTQPQVNVSIGGNAGSGSVPTKGTAEKNSSTVTTEDTYKVSNGSKPTLADRQTVRDIERLFGRPLRAAGVKLADQKTASSLIDEKSLDHVSVIGSGDQAARDRAALTKVADVAVEILVSSRNIVVNEVSGDRSVTVPDIQATAIRLSDAQILGQATASDVLGKDRQAGRLVRNFDVKDIAEATALALMEDINGSAK